jgi:hypothetical protein
MQFYPLSRHFCWPKIVWSSGRRLCYTATKRLARCEARIVFPSWTAVIKKLAVYCILASCYIRFTLNICSFVHQCNIHFLFCIIRRHVSASHGLLHVWQYTLQKLVLCYADFCLCHGASHVLAMCFSTSFWRVYCNTWRWPCEAETCRRIIENKKWMCYIDGKNKYSGVSCIEFKVNELEHTYVV